MMKRDHLPFILNFQVNGNLFLRVFVVDSKIYWVRRVLSFYSFALCCVEGVWNGMPFQPTSSLRFWLPSNPL